MKQMSVSGDHRRPSCAAEIMTREPITCRPDDRLLDAAAKMQQHRIRHLPVVDGDEAVIGMLADRDIRTAIGDPDRWMDDVTPSLEELRVSSAMSSPAVTVKADAPVADVARQLVSLEVGALPVVEEDGHLAGIVSYIDVLRSLR